MLLCSGVVNFYNAGVVTRDRRIGIRSDDFQKKYFVTYICTYLLSYMKAAIYIGKCRSFYILFIV
jgi:hypothetical protein